MVYYCLINVLVTVLSLSVCWSANSPGEKNNKGELTGILGHHVISIIYHLLFLSLSLKDTEYLHLFYDLSLKRIQFYKHHFWGHLFCFLALNFPWLLFTHYMAWSVFKEWLSLCTYSGQHKDGWCVWSILVGQSGWICHGQIFVSVHPCM